MSEKHNDTWKVFYFASMIKPAYLKEGDLVRIISTARKVDRDVIEKAANLIRSWGLNVDCGNNLFSVDNQYAGSDDERRSDLQDALNDSNVKAILCARGGYGTLRLIDGLDFSSFENLPKWIIGYSDVTVLHCHIQQVLGIESIHAPMPLGFADNTTSCLENLRNVLLGKEISYDFPSHELNRTGSCSGEIIGGNLSILYALQGSESFPSLKNKVLFLEDLDEYLYHIDRMILSLKRSGTFKELAGLLIGGMTDMNDNQVPFGKSAHEIIREHVEEYDYPVAFNFPAGHINDNNPIILGRGVDFKVEQKSSSLHFSS